MLAVPFSSNQAALTHAQVLVRTWIATRQLKTKPATRPGPHHLPLILDFEGDLGLAARLPLLEHHLVAAAVAAHHAHCCMRTLGAW
jgi:hypothetical protein